MEREVIEFFDNRNHWGILEVITNYSSSQELLEDIGWGDFKEYIEDEFGIMDLNEIEDVEEYTELFYSLFEKDEIKVERINMEDFGNHGGYGHVIIKYIGEGDYIIFLSKERYLEV